MLSEEEKKHQKKGKNEKEILNLSNKNTYTIITLYLEDEIYPQRYRDDKVYEYQDKVNGISLLVNEDYKTMYLSKSKTLSYFQSDTFDEEIKKMTKSEKSSFKEN